MNGRDMEAFCFTWKITRGECAWFAVFRRESASIHLYLSSKMSEVVLVELTVLLLLLLILLPSLLTTNYCAKNMLV